MHHGESARLGQHLDLGEVGVELVDADRFHHGDRDDAVIGAFQHAIVEFAEIHAIGHAFVDGALLRDRALLGRRRHRGDRHAIGARQEGAERAPARADLGDRHARFEPQLRADAWRSLAICAS